MNNEMSEKVRMALHYLIQTASAEGVVVCGFALSENPPALASFGNCSDHANIKLYEGLCQLAADKQALGLVVKDTVSKPS